MNGIQFYRAMKLTYFLFFGKVREVLFAEIMKDAGMFQWVHYFLMQYPMLSPVLYILLHILFAVCIIPCSPMAVIAGALWGQWLGLSLSILSAFFSSCVTFGLARFLFKDKVYRFLKKRYAKTDWFLEQTQKQGWKFVASVQLNPAAPGSTLGYLFGLTHIEFLVYAKYVLLFMIPLQVLLVFVGDTFTKVYFGRWPWIGIGILFIFLMIYVVMRVFMRRRFIKQGYVREQ